jgi:hypothetical protein
VQNPRVSQVTRLSKALSVKRSVELTWVVPLAGDANLIGGCHVGALGQGHVPGSIPGLVGTERTGKLALPNPAGLHQRPLDLFDVRHELEDGHLKR